MVIEEIFSWMLVAVITGFKACSEGVVALQDMGWTSFSPVAHF